MVALPSSQLLKVWECAYGSSPTQQALSLLHAWRPDFDARDLMDVPVGMRDELLLQLRETLFGRRLPMLVSCPACDEQIELELQTDHLRLQPTLIADGGAVIIEINGQEIRVRVPTSRDLLEVARHANTHDRAHELLARCTTAVGDAAESFSVTDLADDDVSRIVETMDSADPQANVEVPVECVTCRHPWMALFDVVSYLWTELDAWAQRTLNEIHLIASTYGWTEQEILSLSPARRELYVSMVRT